MADAEVRIGLRQRVCFAAVLVALTLLVARTNAYSVLAHQSNVDALWDDAIRPLLQQRFPRATRQEIVNARAYAYGGSVIQDLGYYPFGSHFFSNLVHYVRSGDFVEALVRDAANLDEFAFALGALGHYAADNTGHPQAVNRAVALMFPKLRAKYGDAVTYLESPATHVLVEFSFDVVQAAAGTYAPESYHDRIGFKVAKPVLERAFQDTYGLALKDVFAFDEDLAIGSYRRAISDTIPELTRVAWRDKREEILKLMPGIIQERFLYRTSRQQYVADFGDNFKTPGFFARIVGFLYRLLPKIGPLRPLKFRSPTPDAEAMFLASLKQTRERFRVSLAAVRDRRLALANTDFDTGKRTRPGEYQLADETYDELLEKLSDRRFKNASAALTTDIAAYYDGTPHAASKQEARRLRKIAPHLAALRAVTRPSRR